MGIDENDRVALAIQRAEKTVRMSKDNVWMVRSQALPSLDVGLSYQQVRYQLPLMQKLPPAKIHHGS